MRLEEGPVTHFLESNDWLDPYQILGVPACSSTQTVRNAYRKLQKLYHPDKCPHPHANRWIQQINAAYTFLRDERSRIILDRWYFGSSCGEQKPQIARNCNRQRSKSWGTAFMKQTSRLLNTAKHIGLFRNMLLHTVPAGLASAFTWSDLTQWIRALFNGRVDANSNRGTRRTKKTFLRHGKAAAQPIKNYPFSESARKASKTSLPKRFSNTGSFRSSKGPRPTKTSSSTMPLPLRTTTFHPPGLENEQTTNIVTGVTCASGLLLGTIIGYAAKKKLRPTVKSVAPRQNAITKRRTSPRLAGRYSEDSKIMLDSPRRTSIYI